MASTGIFFGTDTGETYEIAKMIHRQLEGVTVAPANINRVMLADLLAYPALLLGTLMLGNGQLPGLGAGDEGESWVKFIRDLGDVSLQGKTVTLFDLGDQRGYPDNFVSGLWPLYNVLRARGATATGSWPNEGYEFSASSAPEEDRLVGLVLDQDNQFGETDAWLVTWPEEIKPHLPQAVVGSLSAACTVPASAPVFRPATGAGGGTGSVD